MKRIPLTQDKSAIVDDQFYRPLVALGPWAALNRRNKFHAINGRHQYLHRVVWALAYPFAPRPRILDHVNRDGLDCRLRNLRPATRHQNQQNRGPNRNNKSGYKGVWRCKDTGRWKAAIMVDGKRIWLKRHNTSCEAARAYNRAARKYFGRFACLNSILGA